LGYRLPLDRVGKMMHQMLHGSERVYKMLIAKKLRLRYKESGAFIKKTPLCSFKATDADADAASLLPEVLTVNQIYFLCHRTASILKEYIYCTYCNVSAL
jgi:hypothetical protein